MHTQYTAARAVMCHAHAVPMRCPCSAHAVHMRCPCTCTCTCGVQCVVCAPPGVDAQLGVGSELQEATREECPLREHTQRRGMVWDVVQDADATHEVEALAEQRGGGSGRGSTRDRERGIGRGIERGRGTGSGVGGSSGSGRGGEEGDVAHNEGDAAGRVVRKHAALVARGEPAFGVGERGGREVHRHHLAVGVRE